MKQNNQPGQRPKKYECLVIDRHVSSAEACKRLDFDEEARLVSSPLQGKD
jgi:hypothetical protein